MIVLKIISSRSEVSPHSLSPPCRIARRCFRFFHHAVALRSADSDASRRIALSCFRFFHHAAALRSAGSDPFTTPLHCTQLVQIASSHACHSSRYNGSLVFMAPPVSPRAGNGSFASITVLSCNGFHCIIAFNKFSSQTIVHHSSNRKVVLIQQATSPL